VYSRYDEKTLGSIDQLSRLYRASTIELVRGLSARKLQDGRYLVPVENLPWCTVFDLGTEVPLVREGRRLCVKVGIEPQRIPAAVEIGVGFLIKTSDSEYYCLGALITGRRALAKCRFRTFSQPFDLWDFPKIIAIPEVKAICEEKYADESSIINVEVPVECLSVLGLTNMVSRSTRYLVAMTDLVAVMGNVKIRLYRDTLSYV